MKEVIILVGVAGSGKTTYIEKNKTGRDLVLSSDALRIQKYGNLEEGNKHNPQVIFDELHNTLFKNLKNQDLDRIFYDATNLSRRRRATLYNQIKEKAKEVKVSIVFFILTLEELLERNKQRELDKQVPEYAIKRMFKNLDVMKKGVDCDTFDVVLGSQDFFFPKKDVPHDSVFHRESLQEHIKLCIEQAQKEHNQQDREYLTEIAQYHDLGKYFTKEFISKDTQNKAYQYALSVYGGKVAQFIRHEKVSALIYLREMKKDNLLDNERSLLILEVIYQHNQAHSGFTQKYIEREKLTQRELSLLEKFVVIDNQAKRVDKEILERYRSIQRGEE